MNPNDTFLLESKLKRLKISFSKENGRLIISQAQRDYVVLLGLIFFPLFFGIGGAVFIMFGGGEYIASHSLKVVVIILSLIAFGVVNIFRILAKIKANKTTKILAYKEIILREKDTSRRFDASSVDEFIYTVEEVAEEAYYGKLFLVDKLQNQYLLLGFDSETEQYALDDLQWFTTYFEKHIQLTS
ncbi:MAG: hypothetical protein AAF611_22495 [Bacteroidota bacterium]